MAKVLFILKRREDYSVAHHSHKGLSTGLFNSASFVNDMLNDLGIESHLEVVADNNSIDRVVTLHRPTHVIIEALWVVPTKFEILQRFHPKVTWIVRLHSEMPFLAGEGMSMDWLAEYVNFKNLLIACNAPRMLREVRTYLQTKNNWSEAATKRKVVYLPNFYPQQYETKSLDRTKRHVDVACFGAIRPLKNHVVQAIASLDFAKRLNKKLRFHVNMGRIEMMGHPHIRNLIHIFEQLAGTGHELINHIWTPREQFLEVCAQMDIGTQVSFSETFNIVGADIISQGVPLVGSREIPWSSCLFNADPSDSKDIADKLMRAYTWPRINTALNQYNLTKYTSSTAQVWEDYLKGKQS